MPEVAQSLASVPASAPPYFKAIAIDYDGTLTQNDRPSGHVLDALRSARELGLKVVLVTGRVVSELLQVFPEADETFDAIVAENGAVVRRAGVSRALTAPVPLELDPPLVERGVHFQRGQVLLACHSDQELLVLEEMRRLGLDCQFIRNRAALMVLPVGISKGSGLSEVLHELRVSHHNTIGVGDAENDLALLRECELGVAVGNAVDSLKREADIVLPSFDGEAIAAFVQSQLLARELLPSSSRWQVTIGRSEHGEMRLPASQINLLIVGGSGVGKSYAAGLIGERLIELGYSVCILDPEGDHGPLGRMHDVVTVGGMGMLPRADDVAELLGKQLGSVVVDLSLTPDDTRAPFMVELLEALREERLRSGLPHWIVVDEAHIPFGNEARAWDSFQGQSGICLATYDSGRLFESEALDFDYLIALPGQSGLDPSVEDTIRERLPIDLLPRVRPGEALLVQPGEPPRVERFKLESRFVRHMRHWHKYVHSYLPPSAAFRFRNASGPTGAEANNLAAFRRELLLCDVSVLAHHAANHDFSKWLGHAIRDEVLARFAHELEARADPDDSLEHLRRSLVEAIEQRYLG